MFFIGTSLTVVDFISDYTKCEENLSEKEKQIAEVKMELDNITALLQKSELDLKAKDEGYSVLSNAQKTKDSEVEDLRDKVIFAIIIILLHRSIR